MKFDKNAVNRTKKYDLKKQPRSIYKSNEIMAIFLCVNCYGFANVLMDNVWQHVTQPFGYSMSPESHNMACWNYGHFSVRKLLLQSFWWTMFGSMSHNHLDTVCLLNHITWPTVCGLYPRFFLGLSYGLGISSEMTRCAVSIFVTKYSFYGILYPYSVR